MIGDLREKLAVALKLNITPRCEVQQVFDLYKRSMSGKQVTTPLPETVHFRDENFPYWIKLQWHNPETNSWQDASPTIVLPLLEAGTFDEKGYTLVTAAAINPPVFQTGTRRQAPSNLVLSMVK